MRAVWAVAIKELRQAARDPLNLAMLLGIPVMMLLLYGYALSFDVTHARLAVEDRDRSAASRDLVASFVNSTYFDRVADLPAGTDLARLTEKGAAAAILVIPEGFSRDLAAGRAAPAQFVLDGTDSNTATTLLGYASGIVGQANAALLQDWQAKEGIRPAPAIVYEPRVFYNPELKSTPFLIPGLIGFILMLTAVLATALSVVREKERGTLEQLRTTPLRALHLILGKTLPYLGISLLATMIFMVAARILFGVTVRGPLPDLLAATVLYLVGALGFGLLVSTIADTQAMAFQIGAVASMLPAIFLSGFIFPIRAAPRIVQWVTYIVPARYYIKILRGVILKGAGLGPYAREILFLAIYGLIVFGIAAVRLTRREV